MYVLKRWRRDIRRKHTLVKVPYHDPFNTVEGMRHHKMHLAFEPICDEANDGDDTVQLVIDALKELHMKLIEIKGKRDCTLAKDNIPSSVASFDTPVATVQSLVAEVNSSTVGFIVNNHQMGI